MAQLIGIAQKEYVLTLNVITQKAFLIALWSCSPSG